MIDVIALDDPLDARLGGKAQGVATLLAAGLPAPDGRVVPVDHPDPSAAATAVHDQLGASWYAVRSSAVDEDGPVDSAAGRYETVLRVPPDALGDAIRTVRRAAGAGPIPVLVMPFINGECGGVAFSVDPLSGADEVVLAAVQGHHAAVTDGQDHADLVRVSVDDTVDPPAGGVLGHARVLEASAMTRRVAALLGKPVDVEFSFAPDLTLLQARPITGFPAWDAPPGRWTLERDHASDVIPPLVAELFTTVESDAFAAAFEEAGVLLERIDHVTIGDHPYMRPVPLGDRDGAPPPAAVLGVISRLAPSVRRRCATADAFLRSDGPERILVETECLDWEGLAHDAVDAVPADPTDEQALQAAVLTHDRLWRQLYDAHFRFAVGCYMHLVGAWGLAMEAAGHSPAEALQVLAEHASMDEWLPQVAAARAALADASQSLQDALASRDERVVIEALEQATVGRPAVRRLLDDARFVLLGYSPMEPTLAEQPLALAQMLRQPERVAQRTGDPPAVPRQLQSRLPVVARSYAQRDRDGRALIRVAASLRHLAAALGTHFVARGLLTEPAHIWAVSWAAAVGWARGDAVADDLATVAADRHATLQANRRYTPPDTIGGPAADPPDPRHLPRAARAGTRRIGWMLRHAFGGGAPEDAMTSMRGRPASAGRHTGIARVITDIAASGTLGPDEVLITRFTTPAWVPLLEHAGAVVTTHGGPLSHAAIVSRQAGVPAVCGVHDALSIPDGARVAVDGDAGTVTVLDR